MALAGIRHVDDLSLFVSLEREGGCTQQRVRCICGRRGALVVDPDQREAVDLPWGAHTVSCVDDIEHSIAWHAVSMTFGGLDLLAD